MLFADHNKSESNKHIYKCSFSNNETILLFSFHEHFFLISNYDINSIFLEQVLSS